MLPCLTYSKTTYNCKRPINVGTFEESSCQRKVPINMNQVYKATKPTAFEFNGDTVLAHRQIFITTFKLFKEAPNEYLPVLEREENVQCAKAYHTEKKVYIENLKMLNSAMSELSCYSYIKLTLHQ